MIDGDPGLAMNPIYVEDAAAAIEAALGLSEQATVNVAGTEVVRLRELVERLATALGREAVIRDGAATPGDLIADTSLMRELLGVTPEYDLDRGLQALAQSLAADPAA